MYIIYTYFLNSWTHAHTHTHTRTHTHTHAHTLTCDGAHDLAAGLRDFTDQGSLAGRNAKDSTEEAEEPEEALRSGGGGGVL